MNAIPATSYANTTGAPSVESSRSAVAWPAIWVGAAVAAAVSLILFVLGTGLGLSSISVWPREGVDAGAFTLLSAAWLIVMQWVASGMGGYVAGRLRTKWTDTHTHEVFFRDTAHGFATWAVATLLTAALFASGAASLVGAGARVAGTVAGGVAGGAAGAVATQASDVTVAPGGLDRLMRPAQPGADASGSDLKVEASRIIASGIANGSVSDEDKAYLSSAIAAKTGISQPEAQQRIDALVTQTQTAVADAKAAAEKARKASALAALFAALSLLVGAFIACVAAAIGGGQRDLHP